MKRTSLGVLANPATNIFATVLEPAVAAGEIINHKVTCAKLLGASSRTIVPTSKFARQVHDIKLSLL